MISLEIVNCEWLRILGNSHLFYTRLKAKSFQLNSDSRQILYTRAKKALMQQRCSSNVMSKIISSMT